MSEILFIFESLGSVVFVVAALLCFAVGALGFKYDKPCVVVVSLILGLGIGYFLSMAAWNEGIGTVYLGSCIGLLSLLVSIKVRPVKRFFLGGVTIFLAVTAIVVILAHAIGGTTVTYTFRALTPDGYYDDVSVNLRASDIKKDMVEILGCDAAQVTAKMNDSKTQVTFTMPSANKTQLDAYGAVLAAKYDGVNKVEVAELSSAWTIAIIIGAIFGIAAGVLTQFKKFEKFMQILGSSIFAGVWGSVFAYLGLGELCPLLVAPLIIVAAVFLQRFINVKKENDDVDAETSLADALPTV